MPASRLSRSFSSVTQNISLNIVPDIAIKWNSTGEKSPVESIIDGMTFLEFDNEDSQEVITEVRIPNNFLSGTMVKLINGSFFTNEVAGKVKFNVEVTLIRPSLTVQGDYPNVFSTTVETDVDATTKEITSIDLINLCDVGGEINGVQLRAKDVLKIRLYRDSENESVPCNGIVYLLKESFIVSAS